MVYENAERALSIAATDGSGSTPLFNLGSDLGPESLLYSPDGSHIAATLSGSAGLHVLVAGADGGEPRLFSLPAPQTIQWAGNGALLLATRVGFIGCCPASLEIMDINGSQPQQLWQVADTFEWHP